MNSGLLNYYKETKTPNDSLDSTNITATNNSINTDSQSSASQPKKKKRLLTDPRITDLTSDSNSTTTSTNITSNNNNPATNNTASKPATNITNGTPAGERPKKRLTNRQPSLEDKVKDHIRGSATNSMAFVPAQSTYF